MIRFKKDDGSNYPDWEEKQIENIALLCSSKRIHAEDYIEAGVPFYRGKEITELKTNKDISDILFISEEQYNDIKSKYGTPQKNDLLITAVGTLGNTWVIPDDLDFYFKDGNLIWFKDITENSYFLDYLLNSEKGHRKVINSAIGSTQKALTMVELNKLKFMFPCLEEQQKIAEFLSSVDNVIAASEQEIATLEEQKKGVMQKIFSQEVRFKADDGSDYPEWEEKRLEEIGEFYGGLSGKTKDDFGKGEDKYITYMNVYKNTFAKNELLDTVIISENEKQNRVKYGDVLFTQSSETVEEVGLTSVYLFDDEPTLNSFCFGLRTNDMKETYPEFMGYLFRTEYVRKQIMREGQGISRINLSPNRIRSVSMFFPCLKEQQKIANFLSDFDKAIDLAKQELEQWKELKKGLLQQLFK